MCSITATVIYYEPGPYGPIQHASGRKTFFTKEDLSSAVRNARSVFTRSGANHIVLDSDVGLAVQVSGYDSRRGAYCDVLPLDELRPFLDDNR